MKCFSKLGALAFFYFATFAAAQEGEEAAAGPSDVHALGKDTFKEFIAEHPLVLAECEYLLPPLSISAEH